MRRLKKTLVLAITLSFAALYLVACTGTSKDQNASSEASVETSAIGSENGTAVEDKKDNSDSTGEATTSATTEIASEGISFEKVEDGKGGDNAIDSSTVDVSVGEPYDTDPVPVPTDPTIQPR